MRNEREAMDKLAKALLDAIKFQNSPAHVKDHPSFNLLRNIKYNFYTGEAWSRLVDQDKLIP